MPSMQISEYTCSFPSLVLLLYLNLCFLICSISGLWMPLVSVTGITG
uniref:Uncharacterized protein n=1 Tax=Arundo donax TaxID=35708 RepID=A0A0A9QHQ8_ARUDO